ncbi:MAG: hypothetical protein ACK58T_29015, partial [Phycisphaerae bacterium]
HIKWYKHIKYTTWINGSGINTASIQHGSMGVVETHQVVGRLTSCGHKILIIKTKIDSVGALSLQSHLDV